MHGSSSDSGFNLWDAVEGLRSEFERRVAPRMGRGDVRAGILALLAEGPMHGYQIIREIESRSGGTWKPSPGSVYPTLQLLADEGLLVAQEADGRKTYSLTEAGRGEAAAAASAPWDAAKGDTRSRMLPKSAARLAEAVMHVIRGGTPDQADEAIAVIDDARRKLYAILAKE